MLSLLKENYLRLVDFVEYSDMSNIDIDTIVFMLDGSTQGEVVPHRISELSKRIDQITLDVSLNKLRGIKDSHTVQSDGLATELYEKMLAQKRRLQQRYP